MDFASYVDEIFRDLKSVSFGGVLQQSTPAKSDHVTLRIELSVPVIQRLRYYSEGVIIRECDDDTETSPLSLTNYISQNWPMPSKFNTKRLASFLPFTASQDVPLALIPQPSAQE